MKYSKNKTKKKQKTKNSECLKQNRAGRGGDFDPVHNPVDCCPDAQHFAVATRGRRNGRNDDGQPEFGDGGSRLHHVVHGRVPAPICRITQQVEILQRSFERDRPVGHIAVFYLPVADRDQEQFRSVSGRQTRCANFPHHAHSAHFEIGAPFDWPAESRLHIAQFIQGARPVDALPRHGRFDIFVSLLFRRERRARF